MKRVLIPHRDGTVKKHYPSPVQQISVIAPLSKDLAHASVRSNKTKQIRFTVFSGQPFQTALHNGGPFLRSIPPKNVWKFRKVRQRHERDVGEQASTPPAPSNPRRGPRGPVQRGSSRSFTRSRECRSINRVVLIASCISETCERWASRGTPWRNPRYVWGRVSIKLAGLGQVSTGSAKVVTWFFEPCGLRVYL